MATTAPAWFEDETYMNNKLEQLKSLDPATYGDSYTIDSLKADFTAAGYDGENGAYQHFLDYGNAENVSPNQYFDADYYFQQKFEALQAQDSATWTNVQQVKDYFQEHNISAWDHYISYGAAEGINPSAAFDTNAYFAAKVEQLKAEGVKDAQGNDYTSQSLATYFAEQGINPVEHYAEFGVNENLDQYGFVIGGGSGDVVPSEVTLQDAYDMVLAGATLPESLTLLDGKVDMGEFSLSDFDAKQQVIDDIMAVASNKPSVKATYNLTDGVKDLGEGSVKDMEAAVKDAQSIIDGAANAKDIKADFSYGVVDTNANLYVSSNFVSVATSADSVTLITSVDNIGDISTNKYAETLGDKYQGYILQDVVGKDSPASGLQKATAPQIGEALKVVISATDTADIVVNGDLTANASKIINFVDEISFSGDLNAALEAAYEVQLATVTGKPVSYSVSDAKGAVTSTVANLTTALADAQALFDEATWTGKGEKPADATLTYNIADTVDNIIGNIDVSSQADSVKAVDTVDELVAGKAYLGGALIKSWMVEDSIQNIADATDKDVLAGDGASFHLTDEAGDLYVQYGTGLSLIENGKIGLGTFGTAAPDAADKAEVEVDGSASDTGMQLNMNLFSADKQYYTFTVTGSDKADVITTSDTVGGTVDGGLGADFITLGAGKDTVVLGSGLDAVSDLIAGNVDTIKGFDTNADKIDFDGDLLSGFSSFVAGGKAPAATVIQKGEVSKDGIIYLATATLASGSSPADYVNDDVEHDFILIGQVEGQNSLTMWYIEANGTDATTAEDVHVIGTLDGLTASGTVLDAADFA